MDQKLIKDITDHTIATLVVLLLAAIFEEIGPLLTTLFGETAAILIKITFYASIILFCIAVLYHLGVLTDRGKYDHLRLDLARGGTSARIYTDSLTRALNAADHFIGDAGKVRQTFLTWVFGLKTPVPLWSAAAFNRCLLLALLYPIVAVFLFWAIFGDVGPAEMALGLPADLPGGLRAISMLGLVVGVLSYWKSHRSEGVISLLWFLLAIAGAGSVAISIGTARDAGAGSVAGAVVITSAFIGALAGDFGVGVVGAIIGMFAGAVAFTYAGVVVGCVAGPLAVGIVGVLTKKRRITRGCKGGLLSVLVLAMIVACFAAAEMMSPSTLWPVIGPLLLFLGLFTLLNAPFLWLSLGLTRALLRCGLERQQWWPYLYGFIDAAVAVFVIALLAAVIVIGVQGFDFMAMRGGPGVSRILSLQDLFDGIGDRPADSKYWWVYVLLLSTMIPSIINLAIGGLSLMRGVPRVTSYLYRLMPEGGYLTGFDLYRLAGLLAMQQVIGAVLGIGAQVLLIWGIVFHLMPWLKFDMLYMARSVATFDLPMRLAALYSSL